MKIGIDGQPFTKNMSGIGKYVTPLILALIKQFPTAKYYFYSNKQIYLPKELEGLVAVKQNHNSWMGKLPAKVWLKLFGGRLPRHNNIDFYFSTTGFFPKLPKKIKRIVVTYDLNYKIVPKTMGKLHYITHFLFLKHDVRSADFIISISKGTANKVEKYFNKKVNVIINPLIDNSYRQIDSEKVKTVLNKYSINSNYLLSVGTIEPRKNLTTTISVFIDLVKENKFANCQLVLVGAKGWKDAEMNQLYEKYSDVIVRLGYVPDADLPYLYNGASLFLFPSVYEGFGIPVREALACATPVITSDIEELKEAGGDHLGAVYINPLNKEEFANAIKKNINIKIEPVAFNNQYEAIKLFIDFFK